MTFYISDKIKIMERAKNKEFLKNLPWLAPIFVVILWLRLDLTYNALSPLENSFVFLGERILSSARAADIDSMSSSFPAIFCGIGTALFGKLGGRIIALILSVLSMFFFYKFSFSVTQNKEASVYSLIFFSLLSPFIFISKYAGPDIISLTFFLAALWSGAESMRRDDKTVPLLTLSAFLYVLAAVSNYYLILLFPFFVAYTYKKQARQSIIYAIAVVVISLAFIFIYGENFLFEFFGGLANLTEQASYLKTVIEIASFLAIPVMIAIAETQMVWKETFLRRTLYYFLILSLVIPVFQIFVNDQFNVYRAISFSLVFLSPIAGLLINRFLKISSQYKISAIFTLYFLAALSIWQTSRLENSYPNTQAVVKFMNGKINSNSSVYSEDKYLFYVNFKLKNNYLYRLSNEQSYIETIENIREGEYDYVVLNGLIHPRLTYDLKKNYLQEKYHKIYSQEFRCYSLMYPNIQGYYSVYRLQVKPMQRNLFAGK